MAVCKERESIFTRLIKNKCEYNDEKKKYFFSLKNNDKFACKEVSFIADPAYYSTFKMLFESNGEEKSLSDFLNSILFSEEDKDEDEIINLRYIGDEFHKFNEKNNKNMLSTDVVCSIKTKKGEKIVLCLEMQVAKKKSFTKGLFDCGKSLRNNNQYENCYYLGLCLYSEKGTNFASLNRTKGSEITSLNYIKLIEIDISEEIKNMEQNKPIIINGKEIKNKGKEYIKLLGIRNWGEKYNGRYAIPDANLVSSNKVFIRCLMKLSAISQFQITKMELDEEDYLETIEEKREEGKKEGIINSSFILFIDGSNYAYTILERNDINIKANEIREILKGEREKDVEEYIQFLKNIEYLE